jgi:hypothetical protein
VARGAGVGLRRLAGRDWVHGFGLLLVRHINNSVSLSGLASVFCWWGA